MRIDILTLFPGLFASPFNESIIKRARDKGLVKINMVNIRDFTHDRHQQVDDYPYGGGPGMVIKVAAIQKAIESCQTDKARVIYLSPQGSLLNQQKVNKLALHRHLVLLCGHYEGIDHRAMDLIDEEISIGDYVLSGGEIPAMVVVDALVRLIPGALGDEQSCQEESFRIGLLEYPQYTRPAVYEDMQVPEVLLSGHHERIRLWRKKQSLLNTLLKRPELLLQRDYDEEEKGLLQDILFNRERI